MRFLRRVWYLAAGRWREADLADEMDFHRAMKEEEELRHRGVPDAEIAAASQRALGNALLAREWSHDVWVAPWLQDVSQDVRFGVRMLYGVTSYAVTRRRGEIGIRMALGADRGSVVRLVLRRVAILITVGIVLGAGLSLWASTFVASLLYGLQPGDPITIMTAATTLAVVGAMAGWLPAYRASRIDTAQTLRDI